MRANRMPTSMPAKLAIAAKAPAMGLSVMVPSAATSPDSPARITITTISQ